ncbi:MAG: hypothetical protein SGJ04_10345 [Bacteroidota bacterium]|nr:hypothetical protein [Bacteroidota bacterium]
MTYISVNAFAKKCNIPERTMRNCSATGKLSGAFLTDKTLNIPEDATLIVKGNKKKFNNSIFCII